MKFVVFGMRPRVSVMSEGRAGAGSSSAGDWWARVACALLLLRSLESAKAWAWDATAAVMAMAERRAVVRLGGFSDSVFGTVFLGGVVVCVGVWFGLGCAGFAVGG